MKDHGSLDRARCALFICDVQERFEKSIELFEMVTSNTMRMVKAAKLFDLPIVATEQYPKVRPFRTCKCLKLLF